MSKYIEFPLTGLETPLTEMEQVVQDNVHRFACDVLRPAGERLDKLTAEEFIAPSSELWTVLEKAKGLGLNLMEMLDMDPLEMARLLNLASEELAWGDPGLAGMILINNFPVIYSLLAGNMEMAEYCNGKLGCWGITEPDHGSDMLDASADLLDKSGSYGRPNCIARIEGDKIIINGQKSAWVSGGTTAQVCALFCHAEVDGETKPGIAVIVDLSAKGVSRGKPLEKLGLRTLNQGEIFFDNVEMPISHLLAGPDDYEELAYKMLAEANPHVATLFVGLARAAYEHAWAYAHERKAGGVKLVQHQNVRYRLFHMFRKVEMARATTRRVVEYNATAPEASLAASTAAKVTATQLAFEVASDALQMFGGNGMTTEYPMEKLLRDARAGLIADGCNEMLAIKGGSMLVNPELL